MQRWKRALVVVTGLFIGTSVGTAQAGDPVKGAGSTFAEKIITTWATDVGNVSYEGIGSGGGRAKLVAGEVDFAGSDGAAKDEERASLDARGGAVHVPVTAGGLSIAYNVPGYQFTASGPTLAKIFSGKITRWNDPALATEGGAVGPDLPITVVFRTDKSGSTGILTGYLEAAGGGEWTGGTTEQFPGAPGQQGAEGSSGVGGAVAATEGAVSYMEHGVARDKGLAEAKVKNGSGNAHGPEAANVSAALEQAKPNPDGTVTMNYNAGGDGYPISSVSYFISTGKLPGPKYETVKAFLDHALGAGQGKADGLGYAPLTGALLAFAKEQAGKISAG